MPFKETARLVWIKNTSRLGEFYASSALTDGIQRADDLEIIEPVKPLVFTPEGALPAYR